MTPPTDYQLLMARLAELDAEARADRAEAQNWYAQQCANADAAVEAAQAAVRRSAAEVAAARRDAERVQADAAILWTDYVHQVGPPAERFGRTLPRPVVPQQRAGRDAADYLHEVRTRVAAPARAGAAGDPAQWILVVFGLAGGVLGFLAGAALRWAGARAGGDLAVVLPVLALIVTLVGPAVGVVGAKRWTDRRHVTLDATGVALVLVVGLVTAGALLYGLR